MQCRNNLYGKFQDPNKIPNARLILNLWIEKDYCKWYSERIDQTLVISPVKQRLSLDTPLLTWKTYMMIIPVK